MAKRTKTDEQNYEEFVNLSLEALKKELSKKKIKAQLIKEEGPKGYCGMLNDPKRIADFYVRRFLEGQDPRILWNYDSALLESIVKNLKFFKDRCPCYPPFMSFIEFENIDDLISIYEEDGKLDEFFKKNDSGNFNGTQDGPKNFARAIDILIEPIQKVIDFKQDYSCGELSKEDDEKFNKAWKLFGYMNSCFWY